jgi:hypothetical protein
MFYGDELVSTSPTPTLENLLSVVRDCLFNTLTITLQSLACLPQPQCNRRAGVMFERNYACTFYVAYVQCGEAAATTVFWQRGCRAGKSNMTSCIRIRSKIYVEYDKTLAKLSKLTSMLCTDVRSLNIPAQMMTFRIKKPLCSLGQGLST